NVAPHSSKAETKLNVTQPAYNEANLLERVEVWLEQDAEPAGLLDPNTATQHTVKNIDYNAKGQREFIEYGNGVKTTYEYDDTTFRLVHLRTLRGTEPLQDLFYTYDPVGNITAIRDDAQQTIYFNGQVVRPDTDYKYDAIYRLIEATGREHIGQASQAHTTWSDKGRVNLAHPNDGQKMRNYFEFYEYDEVGNILRFDHKAHNGNWIRAYDYNEVSLIEPGKKSNRLSQTVVHPNGQQPIPEPYTHDPHGNMTSMPHLQQMEWDFENQLHSVEKGSEKIYYVYDAAGQRMRKVVEKNNGALIEERIYLGDFEVFRRSNGSGLKLERETLHVMDDQQRIALVETRTQGNDPAPSQLIRYQFGNHLGSASLELDDQAQVISYEEYFPYGSTSYQAVRSQTETPKRCRYTGKERDEETGLNYHSARYYAPWLGRWTNADPAGFVDGVNVFIYVKGNPVTLIDVNGKIAQHGDVNKNLEKWEPILRERRKSLTRLIVTQSGTQSGKEYEHDFRFLIPLAHRLMEQGGFDEGNVELNNPYYLRSKGDQRFRELEKIEDTADGSKIKGKFGNFSSEEKGIEAYFMQLKKNWGEGYEAIVEGKSYQDFIRGIQPDGNKAKGGNYSTKFTYFVPKNDKNTEVGKLGTMMNGMRYRIINLINNFIKLNEYEIDRLNAKFLKIDDIYDEEVLEMYDRRDYLKKDTEQLNFLKCKMEKNQTYWKQNDPGVNVQQESPR
ncbi:MAG: RHS repeat-associated core domain-containing protein, partial [Proteobacteria bacterium]|nr:RHS repeat-associated core domain-containing protein [Pseudomonadota bacterium]